MKIIYLIAFLILAFPLTAAAQRVNNSVCVGLDKNGGATSEEIILTVCNHAGGMAPIPPERLHFRLYKDGRAEFETNAPSSSWTLVTKKMKVDAKTVAEIVRLIEQKDFQNAKNEYPRFRMWTDSSLKTSIYFRAKEAEKKIVLNNFSFSDDEHKKEYPPSLFALLQKIEELKAKN